MDSQEFSCDRCGCCCRNINLHHWYSELDRGDGTCREFDEVSNLCRIYENRPAQCRVMEQYAELFAPRMTQGEYIKVTEDACAELKRSTIKERGNHVSA